MVRNYNLMRNILKKVNASVKPLSFGDFQSYGTSEDIRLELIRLKKEGLIEHNMTWSCGSFDGGEISAITENGIMFLRDIQNDTVWNIIEKTLEEADLDLSYPLLKDVCDEIVKRYVMGKIPSDI